MKRKKKRRKKGIIRI
jgi:hypothetical protein